MKLFSVIFIVVGLTVPLVMTSLFVKATTADSIVMKAGKLKELFVKSQGTTKTSISYQQQFFDEFPSSFMEFTDLYGNNNDTLAILYSEYEKHLDLFNNLKGINDTLYDRKIISIAIGGRWNADAAGAFQYGLRNKVLSNPELILYILRDMPDKQIISFWYFYFDGIYPEKQIPQELRRIKPLDVRIYNLLNAAHNQVLEQPKE